MTPKNILELNNVDIYGKRFNGYSLQNYFAKKHCFSSISFLVNHKFSNNHAVIELYNSDVLTNFDWKIEPIEEKLHIKNQISITEDALISHPLYQSADLLHFHMYHNMHLPIEFLTRIPAEKQIVIDVHDTFWLTDKNIPMLEAFQYSNPNKASLDAQRKRVLNSIDATFVVHSPFILNLFKKSDATKNLKVELIPFGINTAIFKPKDSTSLRKKYHIHKDSFVIMCRSQKEFKGIDYIIDAIKSLKTTTKITIVTVGTKGLLKPIKNKHQIVELGIIDNEKELSDIYNLCDVFLAPSTEESFGFMAVEAMSSEKPVIVFEGTALPYTTHSPDIGIATKKSATALSAAIENLLTHPEDRIARGKAGRKFVLENYTEEKYFESYLDLFNKLLSKKPRKIKLAPIEPSPKNINQLIPFLDGEGKFAKFNFNNSSVQSIIKEYNSTLYSKIIKQGYKTPIKKIIKIILPFNIRRKIRKIVRK